MDLWLILNVNQNSSADNLNKKREKKEYSSECKVFYVLAIRKMKLALTTMGRQPDRQIWWGLPLMSAGPPKEEVMCTIRHRKLEFLQPSFGKITHHLLIGWSVFSCSSLEKSNFSIGSYVHMNNIPMFEPIWSNQVLERMSNNEICESQVAV